MPLAQHGFAELALQVSEVGSGSLNCVRLGCGFHWDGGWPRDRGRVNKG